MLCLDNIVISPTDKIWHHVKGILPYYVIDHRRQGYKTLYIVVKGLPYIDIVETVYEAVEGTRQPFWSLDMSTRRQLYDTYRQMRRSSRPEVWSRP